VNEVSLHKNDLPLSVADSLRRASIISWDIETSGLDWRAAQIATCQLHAPDVGTFIVYMLDPCPRRLCGLLEDVDLPKVFHHAPFDLRFMMHHWRVRPSNIWCTKVASRLLRPQEGSSEHSLKGLLARFLGVEIDKSERLSNWLSSNLTAAQLAYAAEDVTHLIPLLRQLQAELHDAGLLHLFNSCCQFLPARAEIDLRQVSDVFAY
jgi:ribonuclease D